MSQLPMMHQPNALIGPLVKSHIWPNANIFWNWKLHVYSWNVHPYFVTLPFQATGCGCKGNELSYMLRGKDQQPLLWQFKISWLSTLVPATFYTNVQTFSTSNIQKTSIWSNSPTSILSHLSKSFEIHFYSNNGIGNFRSTIKLSY